MGNLANLQNHRSEELQKKIAQLREELNAKIIGQSFSIELCLSAFFAGGHVLLEGSPGVGKTSLSSYLAQSFEGVFHRVQMTSDMLPSDILGVIRLAPNSTEFEFRKGPIFSNVLLVDELNRTSAKTQSALLEAMAENAVSIDGTTHPLPNPFFVIATQNPFESHGVYPLTESQLDRFMVQINLQVPKEKDELRLYKNFLEGNAATKEKTTALFSSKDIQSIKSEISGVYVEDSIIEYCQNILLLTRSDPQILHGVSVRAGLQLITMCRAYAFLQGRSFVLPGDVQACATEVLAHRIELQDEFQQKSAHKAAVIKSILLNCKPPR